MDFCLGQLVTDLMLRGNWCNGLWRGVYATVCRLSVSPSVKYRRNYFRSIQAYLITVRYCDHIGLKSLVPTTFIIKVVGTRLFKPIPVSLHATPTLRLRARMHRHHRQTNGPTDIQTDDRNITGLHL